jgi:hypothetical protein
VRTLRDHRHVQAVAGPAARATGAGQHHPRRNGHTGADPVAGPQTVAPDPTPGVARSRFDADTGVVYYHEGHSDYLPVKDDEVALLDFLATLVAKEYVVYNNPRATPDDLGEEMVRMLIRVRRHLPRRR